MPTGNDDIMARPEQEIDFVEYLRLWASPDANDQAVNDLHKAADEIERLTADRDEWKQIADDLYKAACGHERPTHALNAYSKALRDRLD